MNYENLKQTILLTNRKLTFALMKNDQNNIYGLRETLNDLINKMLHLKSING